MKIWVVGSEGMLGTTLMALCERLGIEAVGTSREAADVTQLSALMTVADELRPTHVINCAAYTDVDRAEIDRERAFLVNAVGAANLAQVAERQGIKLVHVSSDYVFGGELGVTYAEPSVCQPVNFYGWTKLQAEKLLLKQATKACVVRTSWLFGGRGKNFISGLLSWFQEKKNFTVVSDQYGRPTYCPDLAEAILSLLDYEGVIHFANEGIGSRYKIAVELLSLVKERGKSVACEEIIPVESRAFPTLAPRPVHSVLDTALFERVTGKTPRSWEAIFTDLIDDGQTT